MGALPLFPSRLAVCDETLLRYVRTGPRYTSYPPATQFRAGFAPAAAELAKIGAGEDIGLYVHIPFCSQLCWYCGCNVEVTRDRSRGRRYVDTLLREIELVAAAMGGRPRVGEIALGGGSPNFLDPDALTALMAGIARALDVAVDATLGIELDPRDTRDEQVDVLAGLGFRRVSVGVQDFDEAVQHNIHRHQTAAATRALIERARSRGFTSVNLDLVYGLPGQTPAGIVRTLREVVAIAPDRIAVFGYAHRPDLRRHQTLVERNDPVPDVAQRIALLRVVMDQLADAGYVRIGLDHFARPDDPLARAAQAGQLHRNFQGYVPRGFDRLIGVGASAISDGGSSYWQNHVELAEWTAAIDAGQLPVARGIVLDGDDRLRREVITRLMCDGRVEFAPVEARYGGRFVDTFAAELRTLVESYGPLVVVDRVGGVLAATPLGHHLIRNVAAVFDRYAEAGNRGTPSL